MQPAGTCENFTYCFNLTHYMTKFVKLSCKYLTLLLECVPFSPVRLMQGSLTGGHASPGGRTPGEIKTKYVMRQFLTLLQQN